ncbi:MAG TPA: extracellular solute-binding protein [Chloroflexota bacterium]|jgi:ABC-type Fe3+ transport system substrate-binding protein
MRIDWRSVPASLLLLALACAPSAGTPTGAAPPAKPAAATSAPAAQPAASSAAAPAAQAPAGAAAQPVAVPEAEAQSAAGAARLKADAAAWQRYQDGAKREGKVVVSGPGFPALRQALVDGFQQAYGITLEYLGLNGGEVIPRVERELQAGNVTIDVNIGGTSTCWALGDRGGIEDVTPILVDPSLFNGASWRGGHMKPILPSPTQPKDFLCGLQGEEWVMTDLFVNSQMVPPGSIKSWKDLLKPEYKGKIVSYDPRRPGSSQTTVAYLNTLFGEDYLRDLYVGQNVQLTADYRQLAEWVARGSYPIGIALVQANVEPLRAEGLPLERVFPADGPGALTGGFGTVQRIKNGPNPNAAAVFMNWFASKDAQEIWEREMMETSLRTDVAHNVPDYVIPKPGVNYTIDDYNPDYFFTKRVPAIAKITDLLGR